MVKLKNDRSGVIADLFDKKYLSGLTDMTLLDFRVRSVSASAYKLGKLPDLAASSLIITQVIKFHQRDPEEAVTNE